MEDSTFKIESRSPRGQWVNDLATSTGVVLAKVWLYCTPAKSKNILKKINSLAVGET